MGQAHRACLSAWSCFYCQNFGQNFFLKNLMVAHLSHPKNLLCGPQTQTQTLISVRLEAVHRVVHLLQLTTKATEPTTHPWVNRAPQEDSSAEPGGTSPLAVQGLLVLGGMAEGGGKIIHAWFLQGILFSPDCLVLALENQLAFIVIKGPWINLQTPSVSWFGV